jgi:hypothetical protein
LVQLFPGFSPVLPSGGVQVTQVLALQTWPAVHLVMLVGSQDTQVWMAAVTGSVRSRSHTCDAVQFDVFPPSHVTHVSK